jgi:hypothetical protein
MSYGVRDSGEEIAKIARETKPLYSSNPEKVGSNIKLISDSNILFMAMRCSRYCSWAFSHAKSFQKVKTECCDLELFPDQARFNRYKRVAEAGR